MTAGVVIVMQFALATLLPVGVGVGMTLLEKRTRFGQLSFWRQQLVCGVIFGVVAILGTEFGIDTQDATMNVRDAAPIVAGLYFGGPAGIIAGLLGGIERWFSVLWGRGMYTRVACSVATMAAGFYAALLRHYLFDDKKPSWVLACTIGLTGEVLHLLLIFVTNMGDAAHAFQVVQVCAAPMICCNALSVALSGAAIAYVSDPYFLRRQTPNISQRVQGGMHVVVVVGLFITVGFVAAVQNSLMATDVWDTLMLEIHDTDNDVRDASDARLLSLAHKAAQIIPSVKEADSHAVKELVENLNVSEVHVIDANGIIVQSSDDRYLGYDMASADQSAAFLVLLPSGRSRQLTQGYGPIGYDSDVWRKYAGVRIKGGFVQVGYDAAHFTNDLRDQVAQSVANRHVGHEGMLVVFAEDESFVAARADVAVPDVEATKLHEAASSHATGEVWQVQFCGTEYYAMGEDVEGFQIIALYPVSEAELSRDLSVLVTSFMEVLVFAALFAAIYLLIKNVVVRSIWRVNGTLGEITSGDLEAQVDVRDSAEFASLSDDINGTVAALRRAMDAEKARIENDLATAKAIQESALPSTFPPFPEIEAFDIYASMNAAREVGGDFYDFFVIDTHRLGFLLADVSGKGIPAALFMMSAKAQLANYMSTGMELAEAVRTANWHLCQGNDAGMFVTVWAGVLDWETGELTFVNAGHNFPLLRHDGAWTWLKQKCGLFLGTFETAKYRQETIVLHKGDALLLYTDGVNEAFSRDEEEYGNDRLEAFLANHTDLHPHLLVDALRADVAAWAKGAEQSDDITMLALEYGVPPEVKGSLTVLSAPDSLAKVETFVNAELSQRRCPLSTQVVIDFVVRELVKSACVRAQTTTEELVVEYLFNANPNTLVVSIADKGKPFKAFPRDAGDGIRQACGRVDDMAYVYDGQRNVVAFRKTW